MKRFIIISLLALLALPSTGCMWIDTHNYYLFSVCDTEDFEEHVNEVTNNNWKVYLGQNEVYYGFNADRIAEAAQKKGDDEMVSYVRQLERYLECVSLKKREQYSWNYPTAEERAASKKTLGEIRLYAQGKLNGRLRAQHALLFMRCNMMLGQHAENVTFWEKTASKQRATIYREMMQNIYAGALLNTGQDDKAGQIFAEQGDWNSLMTQYYRKRSFQAIRQEYQRNSKSAVLPFLLEDFVNNAQEAVDEDGFGKLFVRDIQRSEAQQMINFAGEVVREGKSPHAAMWMSAKAWLEFLYGNSSQAMADIKAAAGLQGTQRMKDNARVLKLHITAMRSQPGETFDNYLAEELQWLLTMKESDGHYGNALDRIVHQALEPKYSAANRQPEALAILSAIHASLYDDYVDSMQVDHLLAFRDYAKKPSQSALDRVLKPRLELNDTVMDDLTGTKYLRTCQWKEAQQWLQKVPLSYYNEKGYAVYAANRRYNVEPWIKRQWLAEDMEWSTEKQDLKSNPKMDFAREMQTMEQNLQRLTGKARQQLCYDLAVRYAQADQTGDCWFLLHNGKSSYLVTGKADTDMRAKAVGLLQQASQTSDRQLKERALFALAYYYLNEEPWYELEWNSQTASTQRVVKQSTQHYKAWKALADFEQANAGAISSYVARCDEYKQFKKFYRP